LEKFLGRGAFGEVWKALDPELMRPVAIKLPRAQFLNGHDLSLKFRDEARRAASLRDLKDPGIVPVFDVGHIDAGTFIVSEFIDGPTLSKRLRTGPISRNESVRLVARLANSLHKAHLEGLVHRDMKPSNILLRPDGTPTITDFGLAISEDEQLAAHDGVVGTAAYMSPEQARGEGRLVDGRSDLYSLGTIFYQLLTGRLPFQFKSSRDYLDQIARREIRPPRSIDDTIPVELERICLRCLEKEIGKRYSTGRDLADDLQKWVALQQPDSRRIHVAVAGLAALVLAGASLALLGPLRSKSDFQMGTQPNTPNPQVNIQTNPKPVSRPITPAPLGQRLELFEQPLEEVAALKGNATDFWQVDDKNRMLTLRSERNLWILATTYRGRAPLTIRGSVFVDEAIGSAGFCWGLYGDPNAFPQENPKCFAIIIERDESRGPLKLCLKQFVANDFIPGTRWVNETTTIAEATLDGPATQYQALEIVVQETGLEVLVGGRLAWKPQVPDEKEFREIMSAEGAVGLVGRGTTVIVRDATVMFQDRMYQDSHRKAK
jgi:serine/threonine protein kinase